MQVRLLDLVENSPATWIGYGGSRGSAKSHGARNIMLVRRLRHPGTKGLIFRRKYKDLWKNHIQPFFSQFPFLKEYFHEGHRELRLPNGSTIYFGYAEHDRDFDDFEGTEFMDIIPDEATHCTQNQLERLSVANRVSGNSAGCKMILPCTPGNVGHSFVKRIFKTLTYHENEKPENYAFLQARAWDNVEWSRGALVEKGISVHDYYHKWTDEERFAFFVAYTDYGRKLNALPPSIRVGWLLGDWNRYSGQYFDIFEEQRHVKDMRSEIQPWYPRWLSVDWGYAHNAAIYGHVVFPDQRVHTYRELVCYNKTPRDLAQLVYERFGMEKVSDIYISPDMNKRTEGPETIAMQFSDYLEQRGMPRTVLANSKRVAGWMLWYQLMQVDMWSCDPSCKVLIKTLPDASREEEDENPEDIVKVNVNGDTGNYGDDSWDSVRMGLLSRLDPTQAPLEVRVAERVKDLDYTSRQHFLPRVIRDEQKRTDLQPWTMKRLARGAR